MLVALSWSYDLPRLCRLTDDQPGKKAKVKSHDVRSTLFIVSLVPIELQKNALEKKPGRLSSCGRPAIVLGLACSSGCAHGGGLGDVVAVLRARPELLLLLMLLLLEAVPAQAAALSDLADVSFAGNNLLIYSKVNVKSKTFLEDFPTTAFSHRFLQQQHVLSVFVSFLDLISKKKTSATHHPIKCSPSQPFSEICLSLHHPPFLSHNVCPILTQLVRTTFKGSSNCGKSYPMDSCGSQMPVSSWKNRPNWRLGKFII